MPSLLRALAATPLVSVVVLLTGAARANPVPLPFTYLYDTLPKGEGEVEQYVDYTPVKAASASTGNPVWYGASQFQTEYEYGITHHLELGLYVTIAPSPGGFQPGSTATLTEGTGLKERLRLRLFDEGVLPVDVGLYGELVENDHELELEAKIILEKRFGDLQIAANLWGEREYELASNTYDWVANPTLGATYQLSPLVHLGVEGWMRAEWTDPEPATRPFALGPVYYVGPTMMLEFGKIWWALGVYGLVNDVNHTPQIGDDYGPVWARSIIGINL